MIPGLDLAGQGVLIAGAPWAARRAVASYTAAGAKVAELHTSAEFSNRIGIDPTIRLVITIDDGASSWAKLRAAARHAGILQLSEPAAAREGKIILVGEAPVAPIYSRCVAPTPWPWPMWCSMTAWVPGKI